MSLLVKMNRVESTLNGVNKVTGIKLELTTLGPGPTKATTTAQDATIEFFELPDKAKKDATKTDRLFATLSFQIKVDAKGKNPELDGNFTSPTNLTYDATVRSAPVKFVTKGTGVVTTSFEAPDISSDFWVDLDLSAQGKNFKDADTLFLPWDAEGDNVLEIGARLSIAGSVESDVKANNVVTIPIDHANVPEDADPTKSKFACVGVGTVYPLDNSLWNAKNPGSAKAAKAVATSINIFLHDEIVTKHTGVSLSDLDARFGKIFTDAGLPKPTVAQKTDKELIAAGFERRTIARGTAWCAETKKVADPDKPKPNEGLSTSFFDFWFTFEPSVTPAAAGEGAEAEFINDFDPSASPPTKLLVMPGWVVPKSVTDVAACVAHPTLGPAEYKANLLATTLAHEIGHALGLRHALRATGSGYDIGPKNHYDICRGVMTYMQVTNGVSPLGFFGPVHKAVLAKRFL